LGPGSSLQGGKLALFQTAWVRESGRSGHVQVRHSDSIGALCQNPNRSNLPHLPFLSWSLLETIHRFFLLHKPPQEHARHTSTILLHLCLEIVVLCSSWPATSTSSSINARSQHSSRFWNLSFLYLPTDSGLRGLVRRSLFISESRSLFDATTSLLTKVTRSSNPFRYRSGSYLRLPQERVTDTAPITA
jgi:hypothetical protein